MNSKGHLLTSLLKSCIRIISCIIAYKYSALNVLALGFLLAEIVGIAEELVDKR